MVPESPASTLGDDTASWLIKDPSPHQGAAGSGPIALPLNDPLLRTKDAADTAAGARLYFSQRDAVTGRVELMGNPKVKLGDAVALEGVPKAGVDGTYQVMAVRHCLEKKRGFRTLVALGGIP
jgi:phage protein D